MIQESTLANTVLSRPLMRKSDIVVAIIALRSGLPATDKKIRNGLCSALKHRSLVLEKWDDDVDADLAKGIIKHVGSVRGALSMHGVIQDIDIILKRVS